MAPPNTQFMSLISLPVAARLMMPLQADEEEENSRRSSRPSVFDAIVPVPTTPKAPATASNPPESPDFAAPISSHVVGESPANSSKLIRFLESSSNKVIPLVQSPEEGFEDRHSGATPSRLSTSECQADVA